MATDTTFTADGGISLWQRTGRSRLAMPPYTLWIIAILAVLSWPYQFHFPNEWEDVYLTAANHLRHGEDIYRRSDCYSYPPFMAMAAIPFTGLSRGAEYALF